MLKTPISDDTALGFWKMFVVPRLAAGWPGRIKADASAFDHPAAKSDEQHRLLGRNGKPVNWIRHEDGLGGHLDAPIALVTDDYDEVDGLEHLRIRAINYADACRLLRDLISQAPTDLVSKGDAVAGWGVSSRTLERRVKSGELRTYRTTAGGRHKFSAAELDQHFTRKTVTT